MVKFIDVDPDDFPNMRTPHRGRVSYPILKSFLETGKTMVMLDRTGMQQSLQALYSSLSAYIRGHELPIKMFSRNGQVYLLRTDIDESGVAPQVDIDSRENILKKQIGVAPQELRDNMENIPELNSFEVSNRFASEKDQTTK